MDEKITERLLLGAGESKDRIGIKLLCRYHGRERIKICVYMGRNDLHSLISIHRFLLSLQVTAQDYFRILAAYSQQRTPFKFYWKYF
jgi:hypothetical protein